MVSVPRRHSLCIIVPTIPTSGQMTEYTTGGIFAGIERRNFRGRLSPADLERAPSPAIESLPRDTRLWRFLPRLRLETRLEPVSGIE